MITYKYLISSNITYYTKFELGLYTGMAARRKNGAFVSAAVTEAARRQLMAPTACWELQWTTPECVGPGSTLKVYKWVKTNKTQVSCNWANWPLSLK
jgi:hypothetical protein